MITLVQRETDHINKMITVANDLDTYIYIYKRLCPIKKIRNRKKKEPQKLF
jgi:hypothetical protein